MKKTLAPIGIIALALLPGCADVPNPNNESFGHALGRGLTRLTTEKTYDTPYGQVRDSSVEESIYGARY